MLSLRQYKQFLNISLTDTSQDEILQEFIDDATAEACTFCGRNLDYANHKIYLDGSDNDTLVLPDYPIVKINSLQYYDENEFVDLIAAPDTIAETVNMFDNGIIKLLKSYIFFSGSGNIYVDYDAGYSPDDTWVSGTQYPVGSIVIYQGIIYKCISQQGSTVNFNSANWEVIGSALPPADLVRAIKYIAAKQYMDSPAGKSRFKKISENSGGSGSESVVFINDKDWFEQNVYSVLNRYRSIKV